MTSFAVSSLCSNIVLSIPQADAMVSRRFFFELHLERFEKISRSSTLRTRRMVMSSSCEIDGAEQSLKRGFKDLRISLLLFRDRQEGHDEDNELRTTNAAEECEGMLELQRSCVEENGVTTPCVRQKYNSRNNPLVILELSLALPCNNPKTNRFPNGGENLFRDASGSPDFGRGEMSRCSLRSSANAPDERLQ